MLIYWLFAYLEVGNNLSSYIIVFWLKYVSFLLSIVTITDLSTEYMLRSMVIINSMSDERKLTRR